MKNLNPNPPTEDNDSRNFPALGNQLRRVIARFKAKPVTFLLMGSVAALFLFALTDSLVPLFTGPESGGFTPVDFAYRVVMSLLLLGLVSIPMTAISYGAAYKISGIDAAKHGVQKSVRTLLTSVVAFFTALLPMVLVLPGIIMGTRFSLLLSVITVEGRSGFDALSRSWNLVYGYTKGTVRNQILLMAILGLAAVGTGMATGSLGWPVFVVLALLIPFAQILNQVTYEDLNRLKGAEEPIENGYGVYQKLAVLGLLLAIGVFAAGTMNVFQEQETSSDKVAQETPVHQVKTEQPKSKPPAKPPTSNKVTTSTKTESGKDRDWQRYQDITALRLALNSHFNDTGRYPNNLTELVPKYIQELPKDPVSGSRYSYARDEKNFSLGFSLEEGVAQLNAGGHTLTPSGFDTSNISSAIDRINEQNDASTSTSSTPSDSTPSSSTPSSSTPSSSTSTSSTPSSSTPSGNNTYNIYNTYTSGNDDGNDTDNDGLSDETESSIGTDPLTADTDGDGLIDSDEVDIFGTDPTNADTDGDSTSDAQEIADGTDPTVPDTYVDGPAGTTDGTTTTGGSSGGTTTVTDSDNDGLADTYEQGAGTDPANPDTDSDGLADGDEIMIYGTNPLSADTDLDGVNDADEILAGTNPLLPPTGGSSGTTTDDGSSTTTDGSTSTSGGSSGGTSGGGGGGVYIPPEVIEQRIALFGLHEPTLSTLGFWHPAWPGL
jgi:cell division septation protein DedD